MIRTFIAVELPDHIKEAVRLVQQELALKGLKQVDPELVHVTLKFLGDVAESQVGVISNALLSIECSSFNARITGIGVFPKPSYIKVVWLGAHGEFELLHSEVERVLRPFKFKKDRGKFAAHATLARVKHMDNETKIQLAEILARLQDVDLGEFQVDSITKICTIFSNSLLSKTSFLIIFTSSYVINISNFCDCFQIIIYSANFCGSMITESITYKISNTVLYLVLGDITDQNTDAIVNAANSTLMGGGGVDGAIHYRGGPEILKECKKIRRLKWPGGLPVSKAVITTGGKLKARNVIHTVGPIWNPGSDNEPELLREAYINCLDLAVENGIQSISFPSISTGAYGYPIYEAARVVLQVLKQYLPKVPLITEVRLVLFKLSDLEVYQHAFGELL